MQTKWVELKSEAKELKATLRRDWALRRYQKWMQGQVPVEDQIFDAVVKAKSHVVMSWRAMIKRGLDVAFSVTALILGAPLLAVIAIAVKLDSKGPVFYKQIRVGRNGKFFKILKFRTMVEDAEDKSGPMWAKENDNRVTKLGSFLRRTHLDELPQFINVVKNDMSIVGPRPERPFFVELFRKEVPNYENRHTAKPGITGLAQIKRRYDESMTDVKKKLRYDVLYINKMCPLLDVKVIALTVMTMVLKTGR